MDQDKLAAQPVHGQSAGLDRTEPGISPSTAGQQRDVGLAQAESAPRRVLGVRLIDDAVVASFDGMQPPGEFVPGLGPRVRAGLRLSRDARATNVCVQPEDRTGAGKPVRQPLPATSAAGPALLPAGATAMVRLPARCSCGRSAASNWLTASSRSTSNRAT